MGLIVEHLLFDILPDVLTGIYGLWATLGHPGPMLDALLTPFSKERLQRLTQFDLDRFFQGLTKERLQSRLRSRLLSNQRNIQDDLLAELQQTSSGKQNDLHRLFDEFAIVDESGRKVWTAKQFALFFASRLGDRDAGWSTLSLWRCFVFGARYPFAGAGEHEDRAEAQLDIDEWIQAVVLLATPVGYGVAFYSGNYCRGDRYESERLWKRFITLARYSGENRDGSDENDDNDDDWQTNNVSYQVGYVAYQQMLEAIPFRLLSVTDAEDRPEVRAMIGDRPRIDESAYEIPLRDLLDLVCAVLQVHKTDPFIDDISALPNVSIEVLDRSGREHQIRLARDILRIGGMEDVDNMPIADDAVVSFDAFVALNDRFARCRPGWHTSVRIQQNPRAQWILDREVTTLWRALFFSVSDESTNDSTDDSTKNNTEIQLPTLYSQALTFFYPLPNTSWNEASKNRQLIYSSLNSDGLSRDALLGAMNEPSGGKFVLIYGTTEQDSSVLLAVRTSSPLWSVGQEEGDGDGDGQTDDYDYTVDDRHLLLELMPQPRSLFFYNKFATPTKRKKYVNLVSAPSNSSLLSFGCKGNNNNNSGLTLDLTPNAAVATFRSSPPRHQGRRVPLASTYVEIPMGPLQKPFSKHLRLSQLKPWERVMRIEKIEVYLATSRVAENLAIKRPKRSERRR